MSLKTTERNYILAKELNKSISDKFYVFENGGGGDVQFMAATILEEVSKLSKLIPRIDINELDLNYCSDDVAKFKQNIDGFKETAFFVKRTVSSMMLYDKLRPVISNYIKGADWYALSSNEKEAADILGRYLTSEDNYEQFKGPINSMIRGTMRPKAFHSFFETVKMRLTKNGRKSYITL